MFEQHGDIYTNEFTKEASYLAAGAVKQAVDMVCTN